MNLVILSGNVSQIWVNDGDNTHNVKVCIADNYRTKDGSDKAIYIPIMCYDRNADWATKHLKKGDHISVQGILTTYRNNNGAEVLSVIARRISFEGYKRTTAMEPIQPQRYVPPAMPAVPDVINQQSSNDWQQINIDDNDLPW